MDKLKVLNRNQLKYIAMLLMLCDHIGLAFFEPGTTIWVVPVLEQVLTDWIFLHEC